MANKIFKIYVQTFSFLVFFLIVFSLCRVGFIIHSGIINKGLNIPENNIFPFLDFLNTILAGLRYDGRIIGSLTLIFLGLYILFIMLKKTKFILLSIYSFTISFFIITATVVNDTYFFIYNDTFNIILLGAVFDDQTAIFQTAFNSDYNVPLKLFLIVLISISLTFLYIKLYKKIENKEFKSNIKINIITGLFLVYFIPFVTSSTINLQGGDLNYIVTLPENNFLKKATPGAIHDLDRVNRAYNNIKGESFEKYAGGGESISNVLKKYFNHITIQDNISLLMEKEVSFDNHKHAEHIFLIIMESLSEYHLSHEFEESGISKSMYKLINSENGLKVPVFIQNGYGTIETLDLMVTGLYSTYFPVSEMTSKIPCFDSSTGKIFKKLGYDTSFYYFGSSAWRKIGNYVLSQGFNQSYAMENMKNKRRSTWGIYDNEGFEFIYDEIKNHKGKTFNMILSTSNHPPYDIDITDYNIDTKNIETFLDEKYPKEKRYSGINSQILSVTAYSIESVTDFIEKTYKKYPKSLFIITGDHFDRIHPNPVRDIYTTTSIPLIMYGYGVKDVKLKYEAASHKNIVPTIVEMNAPLGFKYHSFGDSFITYDNNSLIDYERIAIGAQSIANGRFIYNGEKLEYFNGVKKEKNDINTAKEYINKRNYGRAISWYIVNKGYEIK